MLPDIDFSRIRPYGRPASRSNAFEELGSILIEQGVVEWPTDVRFYRFGNPDGGREGKGVLPDGDVWAWQTKYLFEFDASAAGQVTASVRRVLEREPSLKRYFVALPLDLPAGDTGKQKSAYTRWTEKVSEWEALARTQGIEVEFVFVGAHQLVTALTEPRHAGRVRYWFATDALSPEWQGRRLAEVVAKAGRRYSPQLHVEVDAVRALDAVGRSDSYVELWQHVLAELRRARRWPWRAPSKVDVFDETLSRCAEALDDADRAMKTMISAAQRADELPSIEVILDSAVEVVSHVDELLHVHSLTKDGYFVDQAASLYSKVNSALGALHHGEQLACAEATRAARERVLLLTGRAGVGKTHLFCDVASRRIEEGRPTIVLLGQDFDDRSLLTQTGALTQFGGSLDDVLAVLDAASEAAGCTGLFMIDALNESERPERWRDDVQVLVTAAARYAHVALVLSCRTEFVDTVVGTEQIPAVQHVGFAEATDIAVQRFTQEFGLEPPTFPVLNPEFSNPLFLKLTCEALETLGANRFPFGTAGITTVCNAFLEAVNKRLSQPGRCDYDERTDLVGRVVRELAVFSHGVMDRADVLNITETALPGRSWSSSLMRGLIAEGVLMELTDGRITFGYQRLGDVTRAATIAEKSPDDIRAWLHALDEETWQERGVLGALAVLVPERYEVELIDLALDDEGKVSHDVIDSFLESLLLRSPDSVSLRSVEIVRRLLDNRYRVGEIWDRLVRISCVSGHPLNAEWLHTYLTAFEVADRDRSWSTWVMGTVCAEEETAVSRLISWAWPLDLRSRSAVVPDDVAALATLMFGWLLTTSDRRVRDHATKAIVSVAERAPAAFAQALERFRGTNDPYVIERLSAVACGVVLRINSANAVRQVADSVMQLVEDGWPLHLMTRDFIRRIFDRAHAFGWSGPNGHPPYDGQWPVETRQIEEIKTLAGPPDYAYGSIWHSLTGIGGDFGRYIVRTALDDIDSEDRTALLHDTERAIFERVVQLGWTPERFGAIDRQQRPGRREGVVERIGKKYQWIGFYEVLGRITDHYLIKKVWEDGPRPYEYAEQLIWRDIDPTVLARKPTTYAERDRPWFSPLGATFQQKLADSYPTDMTGIPDPLDLIAVSDPDGTPWLVLVSTPTWEQPVPPEVKAQGVPRFDVWMQFHAYLMPSDETEVLREWAKGKDWYGRWMPEIPEPHNVLLGAHPDDPEWSAADGHVNWWRAGAEEPQPVDLVQCAAWYGGTGTSRDASADEETRGYVPSRRLLDLLGQRGGVDFAWSDDSGVAIQDPSVVLGGPGTLAIRRDLVPRLTDAGLTVFWTVLVGHELHHTDHRMPGDDYRWVSASASYILTDDRIEQIGAIAARYKPGPTIEHQLQWVTRTSEG